MFDSSIVKKTGQIWKLGVFAACVLAGGACLLLARPVFQGNGNEQYLAFFAAAPVLILGGMAFAAISIRCPQCGVRWFWSAISKSEHNTWLAQALGHPHCPGCGSEGSDA